MIDQQEQKSYPIIFLIIILIGIGFVVFRIMTDNSKSDITTPDAQAVLENRLMYLKNIQEVAWVKIQKNDVYMAFIGNQLPSDYKDIANAAAMNGSHELMWKKMTVTRCSVWIIPESSAAGDVSKIFYVANVRKGKLEK